MTRIRLYVNLRAETLLRAARYLAPYLLVGSVGAGTGASVVLSRQDSTPAPPAPCTEPAP